MLRGEVLANLHILTEVAVSLLHCLCLQISLQLEPKLCLSEEGSELTAECWLSVNWVNLKHLIPVPPHPPQFYSGICNWLTIYWGVVGFFEVFFVCPSSVPPLMSMMSVFLSFGVRSHSSFLIIPLAENWHHSLWVFFLSQKPALRVGEYRISDFSVVFETITVSWCLIQ